MTGRSVCQRSMGLLAAVAALALMASCAAEEPTPQSPSPTRSSTTAPTPSPELTLVAIGDSIPYNSPDDCPGCTGFVDRYAAAVEEATGKAVAVRNLTQHTGLTLPGLLDELESFHEPLAAADIILVGIAHNSFELASDTPCGAPLVDGLPDWSQIGADCAEDAAAAYAGRYDELFARVAEWRDGEPTVLRTINRYNDWIGWTEAGLTPEQEAITKTLLDAWNTMLCAAAEAHAFACVDVYHAFNGPDGLTAAGELLASDYTHPSDPGNELIADLLAAEGFAPLG